jgi:hypothetical protein
MLVSFGTGHDSERPMGATRAWSRDHAASAPVATEQPEARNGPMLWTPLDYILTGRVPGCSFLLLLCDRRSTCSRRITLGDGDGGKDGGTVAAAMRTEGRVQRRKGVGGSGDGAGDGDCGDEGGPWACTARWLGIDGWHSYALALLLGLDTRTWASSVT